MSQLNSNLEEILSQKEAYLTPSNIRAGVTVLGVTGNLAPDKPDQTKTATPTTSQQLIEPDTGYELASVTINAVDNTIDQNITAGNIKKDVSILGVTGTYEAAMKEYASAAAMNSDISNITVGEVVKVVSGGDTTYYVKSVSSTSQPFDFSTLSDGDTISLQNMRINNSALAALGVGMGEYLTITFSNNNTPVLEFYFAGGRTQIAGSVTLNNTDVYNYAAASEGSPSILSDADVATINSDSIWNSSTLLEVSSDALSGSAYSQLSGALIEQINTYSMVELIKEQDTNKLNLFVQSTEPEAKKGIWLQKNATPDYYTYDEEVFVGGTWLGDGSKANIPYNFYKGGAVIIGTDVYLFGSGNSSYYKTAYKYNTLTNTYTQLTNIPFDFYYGSASAVGTDVYLFGSSNSSYRRRAYKYDTTNDTYTPLTNIPYDFRYGSTVSIGTNIYLLGSTDNMKYNYKYDTLTDTYTKLANIPDNFYGGSAVAIGTEIFLFGGIGVNTMAYKYNTTTDTYTQLTAIPYTFNAGGAVAMGTDVYLFGSGQTYFKNNYKYNTLTDTYTQLTDIPYNFYSGNAVPVGTNAYLFGGEANNTKVQVYSVESKTYSQDNLVVISQGKYSSVGYEIELFDTPKDVVSPKYAFADAWYYTTANGLETDIPTYYGNGTAWTKIKN